MNFERFANLIKAHGGRLPEMQTEGFFSGRFTLPFTITDNALTASDLTGTGIKDQAILSFGAVGVANPACVCAMEAISVSLDGNVETEALMTDVLEGLFLRWQSPGGSYRVIPLAGYVESRQESYISTTSRTARIYLPQPVLLDAPLWANLELDTLEILPTVAVNTGANVEGTLCFEGFVFSNAGYSPEAVRQLADRRGALDERMRSGLRLRTARG